MNLSTSTRSRSPALAWLRVIIVAAILAAAPAFGGGPQQASIGPEGASVGASRAAYSEAQVKAAFLFNFAGYAEWPADHRDGTIAFAVLGAADIADELERFARNRSIQGRPAKVRRIRSLDDLAGAEVLFIGASQNPQLKGLIGQVHGPTLIITDAPDGLPRGGMINFQVVDRRVRFEVALPAVQNAGLNLSSRLLSAAMRVEMSRCHLECNTSPDRPPTQVAAGPPIRNPNRA